jgi:hypothetical protein
MTVEEFAQFWQRQGCQTRKGAGTFWYAAHPLVFLSLPYDRVIQPTQLDFLKTFSLTPALVLRYPAKTTGVNGNGTGGVYICELKGYDLTALQPKARNQTRKALRECTVQRIEFSVLIESGYQLNEETWRRQGRGDTDLSQIRWQRYCQAAANTPDMEAWGAFVGGRLAAFVVCALVERCYNILHQSSSSEMLSYYPNNALAYAVTKGALEQTGVDLVSYGLKSVENTGGLEHFKLGMGYSLRPFEEEIALHPVLRVCLALGGKLGVQWAAARKPDSDFWRKALAVCQIQKCEPQSVV